MSMRWTNVSCNWRRDQNRTWWSTPQAHIGSSGSLARKSATNRSPPSRSHCAVTSRSAISNAGAAILGRGAVLDEK